MAFCRWLSHKLEMPVDLPTEWQWERAARGTEGQRFPWGGEYRSGYANICETSREAGRHYLARTSPVGIYPQGATPEPECVHDLAGNVWEWCRNEHKNPERTQAAGGESRVLRGGSWIFSQEYARADDRYDDHPVDRNGRLGFRVVVSSPIHTEHRGAER